MKPKNQKVEEHVVSDRLLKTFIAQTPIPIQIHSMDGMLIDFNSGYAELFSLSDAVVKELINTYNVLEDKQAEKLGLMPYVKKTFKGEIVSFPEYEYDPINTLEDLNIKHDTSRKRWIKTKGFSIKDDKGVVTQIVFISEDITEKNEAEYKIKESEERFRNLMEQSPFAISMVNPDGRIDQVNQAFMKLWGFTAEAWPGIKDNYNFLEDAEAIRLGTMPLIEKAFNGEIVELPLIEYIAKNTTDTIGVETRANRRWVQVRLYPIKNGNGDIVKVVDVAEDITSRKQAEIALRESEADFRNLIEQNPQLIEVYKPNGQLVKLNNTYRSLIGFNDETIQWMYDNYNLLEDGTVVDKGLAPGIKKVFSGEHVNFDEYEFDIDEIQKSLNLPVQNKGKIWVKSSGFPIKNELGDITQVVFLSNDVSQKHKAEKELKQARLFTDKLIHTANVMIVGIDAEGSVNIFNPASERISGYSFEEIKDKDWFSTLVPKEKYPEVHKEFNRLMEGGIPKMFENPILSKNGKERIITWTNNEVIKKNKPAGVISFGIDVTEQKKAEEERNRLFHLSIDMIGITAFDGTIKQINPAWEVILGYSVDELISTQFQDYIHPEDIQKTNKEVERLAAGHKTVGFENRYMHKDGTIRHISWTATPLVEEDIIYCIGRDITEQRKADLALIESEEKHRNLIEHLSDGLVLIQDDKLVFTNKVMCELTGYTESELIGKAFIDFIDMNHSPEMINQYRKRDNKDEWSPYEINLRLKNGISVEFEFSASHTTYLGEPAIMVLSRDISDRKKAENQILSYQQRLKDLALELTFAEEKQRKEIATDLHDDVGQLLASSRMQIAAIDRQMSKSAIFDELNCISTGLLKAITATRRAIFELSPPQLNEIGLGAALSDWIEDEMETKHQIKSELLGGDQRFVISNEVRFLLFRCVRELLINVIKHAQATQVKVRLAEKGDALTIFVEDDGIGFIYNPDHFGQKDSGFGLFSIQERIHNIGGTIDIESIIGSGTKITLFLPLKD